MIRIDQGNALLVGVGGSGKQSLTKLAAFAAGCEVFEIKLSRGYSEQSFREDLKVLYGRLGIENRRVVFLFGDQHVAEEGFLELINNMLTSGMVPALYTDEEKEGGWLFCCLGWGKGGGEFLAKEMGKGLKKSRFSF